MARDDLPEREHEQDRDRLTSLRIYRSSAIISFTNCISNYSEEVVDACAGGDLAVGESRAACPCIRTPATIPVAPEKLVSPHSTQSLTMTKGLYTTYFLNETS